MRYRTVYDELGNLDILLLVKYVGLQEPQWDPVTKVTRLDPQLVREYFNSQQTGVRSRA
jgi:hypothetical protein